MKTCRDYIKKQLENKPSGLAGGILEDNVRDLSGHKSSTVSRVARAMYEEGLLQRQYINSFVHYRLR